MRSFYPRGNALQRALGSLRHEGLRTFGWKLAAEAGLRRIVRLERRLDEPIAEARCELPVEFGVLDAGMIDEYLAARPGVDRGDIESLLRAGRMCFLVRHDGRIVSSCWASTESCHSSYLGREIVLEEGDVYFNDAWTAPAMRGHGLAHALCLRQLRYFRDRGFRRAIRGTVPENHSALRAHRKSGFRPIALLARLRLGPWQLNLDRPRRER
jgi:GNAT superfamily N-acetyltransferase